MTYRSESTMETNGMVILEAGSDIRFEATSGIAFCDGLQVLKGAEFTGSIGLVYCTSP